MARKNILSPDIAPTERQEKAPARPSPRGAVGALQSSLNKLNENAVQDIDATLIDDAGFEDRLGTDAAANTQLKESLQAYGQQVPVLLRPHATKTGRYEIVYGRRRLQALKELGMPVKAMIRHLDDQALVMAQGQENTSRQDLSFIEKASFAAQLQDAGYERQTIADALSIDLPMVSRMLKVGMAFPMDMLRAIGSAPGIGRDRWMELVKLLEDEAAKNRALTFINRPDILGGTSEERFEAVFARAENKPPADNRPKAATKPRTLRTPDGQTLGDIRANTKGVALTVSSKTAGAFAAWLNENAESVVQELHDRWQSQRAEEDS